MLIGILTALLAAIPGFADFSSIRSDHPARKVAISHMILNLLAVVVYAIDLSLRLHLGDVTRIPITPFALSIVGIGLLSISGYLGGVMVYDDGIAVGRHRRWSKTPTTTLRPNVADAVDGWVLVARSGDLRKDQTLRVEIAATVMVLARVDGQVCAVQEFCTHRCGPLSDGALCDGQIECPWHRSCFDLKTGKPTHGPAKVDLRTFEVRELEGEIWIRVPIAA
jgi:nitrite reductase/ring-hydroxylating ferredoxin subunit